MLPPDALISPTAKLLDASESVNDKERKASLEVSPELTSEAAMAIVGAVLSEFQEKLLEAVFPLPAASVKVPPLTLIDVEPSPTGVNVAL